eukprot:354002-Chlamydomonas_euryale.AAC.5
MPSKGCTKCAVPTPFPPFSAPSLLCLRADGRRRRLAAAAPSRAPMRLRSPATAPPKGVCICFLRPRHQKGSAPVFCVRAAKRPLHLFSASAPPKGVCICFLHPRRHSVARPSTRVHPHEQNEPSGRSLSRRDPYKGIFAGRLHPQHQNTHNAKTCLPATHRVQQVPCNTSL